MADRQYLIQHLTRDMKLKLRAADAGTSQMRLNETGGSTKSQAKAGKEDASAVTD